MLLKTKVKGFTLLECLIALIVITGSLAVYQAMTQLVNHHVTLMTDTHQEQWLLFSQQLRQELDGTEFVKVEGNRLYINKGKQELAFGKSSKDDFRKTNANGRGYQPMLYELRDATIEAHGKLVTVHLIFNNGLERDFIYAF